MRKILLISLTVLSLMIAVSTARAQNQIDLGGTASGSITFTGAGSGDWTMTFTPNPLTGGAFGTGIFTSIGPYSITDPGGVTITGTLTAPGSDLWNIVQTGSLLFSYGAGGSLLTGNLQLVDLSQTGSIGTFNDTLVANLVITGGTLASVFTPSGILQLVIDLPSGVNLSTLISGQLEYGYVSSGSIYPTPEPASMLLVGSGLVGLGYLARRRKKV